MKITFCDINSNVVEAWKQQETSGIVQEIVCGDILSLKADAIVSPANSFGFMDGGIDYHYMMRFGSEIEKRLRNLIYNTEELLVGQAVWFPTQDHSIPILISAPTMRVPSKIHDPIDVFLAVRAAIRKAIYIGATSILFPGMGTGCGEVDPKTAAKAMINGVKAGLKQTPRYNSWKEVLNKHINLEG